MILTKIMNVLEPITETDLYTLKPGEWIWDNKRVAKAVHKQTLSYQKTYEPIGFRQIHFLNAREYPKNTNRPFMLTNHLTNTAHVWEPFEENRYFRFKWDQLKGMKGL